MCPFASGRVVQSSWPTVCASTTRKSQSGSVSYDVLNSSLPLVLPVKSTVLASRLYVASPVWENMYELPSGGSNAGGRSNLIAWLLSNCGYSSGLRIEDVVSSE